MSAAEGPAEPTITIRAALPQDAVAVAALEEAALGPDAWPAGLVTEGVAGHLPTVTYLVAERGGEVVGHVVLSAAGDIAELQRIAVAEQCRRRGIASLLVSAALDAAARTEADRMLLEVREDNAGALGLYARLGFVEIDRRQRYYSDGATAVVLRLGLGRGCGDRKPGGG